MIRDIHPTTPTTALKRDFTREQLSYKFPVSEVTGVVGMSASFIRKALNVENGSLTLEQVLVLLDLDAFAETFIPRSRVPMYFLDRVEQPTPSAPLSLSIPPAIELHHGCAQDLISRLPARSIQCVVTSTPYWGMRLYDEADAVQWADGEVCPFGNEQTPEAFIRHTVELLFALKPAITVTGSVWWNLMDTYNTRTQIRGSAVETLRAMRGEDARGWHDHDCRRYSAGHSFLKDGEQCLIPARVAERASRIGYYVKSIITWKKNGSLPETVGTRVTRELEHIIHLAVDRSPLFNKNVFLNLPISLGGRHPNLESEKLTDVWSLRTSSGRDGHGAQFPVELPARCIALSTNEGDLVLDPFIGAGTTALAAQQLNRRCIGFDIGESYLDTARGLLEGKKQSRPATIIEEDFSFPLLRSAP